MKFYSMLLIVGSALIFDNCSTDMKVCTSAVSATTLAAVPAAQLAADLVIIESFLAANSITALEADGVRYVIHSPGTGKGPCQESSVSVIYTGKILNANGTIGKTFDSSATPVTFALSNLILGWKVGFPKLNKGAVATLYVPSGYGYGPAGNSSIPGNSILIFDVTLSDIAF